MKGRLSGNFIKKERFFGKESSELRDYRCYRWKRGERTAAVLVALAATVFTAYFFYRSLWAVPPLLPVGGMLYRSIQKRKEERQREELTAQFRECILAVSTLLEAGYSVENAFLECGQDMALMYGEDAMICGELKIVRRGLHINVSLEEMLADLGERSGGNLAEIIKNSAELIGRRADLKQEIDTLLSGKTMEMNIMRGMPFAILLYIGASNRGYFDMLYESIQGRLIMTGCLAAYVGACALGGLVIRRMRKEWSY